MRVTSIRVKRHAGQSAFGSSDMQVGHHSDQALCGSSGTKIKGHATRTLCRSNVTRLNQHANRTSCGPNVTRLTQHMNRTAYELARKWRNGARLQKTTTLLAENERRGLAIHGLGRIPGPRRTYDLRFRHDAAHHKRPIGRFATNDGLQSGPLAAFPDTRAQKQRNRNARQPASKQQPASGIQNEAEARPCTPNPKNMRADAAS